MKVSSKIEKAKELAQELELKFELILHEKSGKTTEDAVIALGVSSNLIIKTLILHDSKKNKFIGLIILGSDRANIKKIIKASLSSKLSFASEEQIRNLTGFEVGGVPAMAIIYCDYLYIDQKIEYIDFVIGAGGDEYCGMKFSPKELISKLPIQVIDAT